MSKPTVVSLFSGAGGFDWGFHKAGFVTRLACEKAAHPAATLAHNLKLEIVDASVPPRVNGQPLLVQGDIQDVDFSQVGFGPDVLIGGPPCQDFSMAKGQQRQGLDGDRGKLYLHFVRAVMYLQPKVFVFENVPGMQSANDRTAYDQILSHLQHLDSQDHVKEIQDLLENSAIPQHQVEGYDLLFNSIVEAPHLGIPQTRKRLIVIGVRRDLQRRIPSDEYKQIQVRLKTSLNGEDRHFKKYPLTALEIFEGKPLPQLQERYIEIMKAYESLANEAFPQARAWREKVWNHLTFDIVQDYFIANQLEYSTYDSSEFEEAMEEHEQLLRHLGWLDRPVHSTEFPDNSNKNLRQSENVRERMYMIPPDENHEFVVGTKWHVEGKKISFIYRRSHPLKPSWTVMAYGGGGTYGYHYERNRAMLTLRERARIQTFSDDFDFKGVEVRAQIGEAVPPLMGEVIANEILTILSFLQQ